MDVATTTAASQVMDQIRCQFCHEYIPRSHYDRHVEQHLNLRDDGQQTDYATLPPERRDPSINFATAPRRHRHKKCNEVTGMPEEVIQTYLTDPWFYLSDKTFCTGCGKHVRQRECEWEETGENLQSYTDRLRSVNSQLRPGMPKRILAWLINLF